MTELSVHTELLRSGAADPLAGGLLPAALVLGGVLAAALIGAFATPGSGAFDETGAPEPPSIATAISTPAAQPGRVAAAIMRPPLPFGFREFDWDPNAPDGVPGFDSWPSRPLSVTQASTRN